MCEDFWKDEDIHLFFQYYDGNVYAHCRINKWNKTIALKMRDIYLAAKEELRDDGFKHVFTSLPVDDAKALKFNNMFGFKEIGTQGAVRILVLNTGE